MREKLLDGAGAIAAIVFVGLQFFLFVGGVSYRKDCLSDEGKVRSDWTFTVFAPVPYVFRPSEAGCQVHTGTRVALNAIGVATFAKPSTTTLADNAVDDAEGLSAGDAYFARIKARLVELQRAPQARDFAEGQHILDDAARSIESVTPPAAYAAAHTQVVSAVREMRRSLDEAETAQGSEGRTDDERAVTDYQTAGEKLNAAIGEINRVHESN